MARAVGIFLLIIITTVVVRANTGRRPRESNSGKFSDTLLVETEFNFPDGQIHRSFARMPKIQSKHKGKLANGSNDLSNTITLHELSKGKASPSPTQYRAPNASPLLFDPEQPLRREIVPTHEGSQQRAASSANTGPTQGFFIQETPGRRPTEIFQRENMIPMSATAPSNPVNERTAKPIGDAATTKPYVGRQREIKMSAQINKHPKPAKSYDPMLLVSNYNTKVITSKSWKILKNLRSVVSRFRLFEARHRTTKRPQLISKKLSLLNILQGTNERDVKASVFSQSDFARTYELPRFSELISLSRPSHFLRRLTENPLHRYISDMRHRVNQRRNFLILPGNIASITGRSSVNPQRSYSLHKHKDLQEWYTRKCRSSWRMMRCCQKLARMIRGSLESRSEKSVLHLAAHFKKFIFRSLINGRPPSLTSSILDKILRKKTHLIPSYRAYYYHPRLIRRSKGASSHDNPLPFKHPQKGRYSQNGIMGSQQRAKMLGIVNTIFSWIDTHRQKREASVEINQDIGKLSGVRLLSTTLTNRLEKPPNSPSFGVVRLTTSQTADQKSLTDNMGRLEYHIPNRKSSNTNMALFPSRPSMSVISAINDSEGEHTDRVLKISSSPTDVVKTAHKSKGRESSNSFVSNAKTPRATAQPPLEEPRKTSRSKQNDLDNSQACSSPIGILGFLRCKSSSAIMAIRDHSKFFLDILGKSLLATKSFIKRQYDSTLDIFRWIRQKSPTLSLRNLLSILYGEPSRDSPANVMSTNNGQDRNQPLNETKPLSAKVKNLPVTRQGGGEVIDVFPLDENKTLDSDQKHSLTRKKTRYHVKPKRTKMRKKRSSRHWDARRSLKEHNANTMNIHFKLQSSADINDKLNSTERDWNKPSSQNQTINGVVKPSSEKSPRQLKFEYLENASIREGRSFTRSPRHWKKSVSKNAKRPRRDLQPPRTEAHAMTDRLLELMATAKEHTDPKSMHSNSDKANEGSQYDIGTIHRDKSSGDINVDVSTNSKPTEADRQLLESIEHLTFLVLGRDSDPKITKASKTSEPPHFAKGTYSIKDKSNRVMYEGYEADTLTDKSKHLKASSRGHHGEARETDSESLKEKLEKETRRTGLEGTETQANRRHNGSFRRRPSKNGKNRHRKTNRHRNRSRRDVKANVKPHAKRSLPVTPGTVRKPGYRISAQKRQSKSNTKTKTVSPLQNSRTAHRQRRSLDTIDLMDDFRLLWPSLRAKATTLVNRIYNLKSTYDAAADELNRLLEIGKDYNTDAKLVAVRDKTATAYLKSETEKMKTAKRNFEQFQRQIANEEELTMNYERKANNPQKKFSKSHASLYSEARTIPIHRPEETLNEIVRGPVLSRPMSENYLQTLPLEDNRQAGLESMLLHGKPVNKHSHDENMHMVAGDLSEISSRAKMNIKAPERRRRSTMAKRNTKSDTQVHPENNVRRSEKKGVAVAKKSKKASQEKTERKEKRKGNNNRRKRASKRKSETPLRNPICINGKRVLSKPITRNQPEKMIAAQFDSMGRPKVNTQQEKAPSSGYNSKDSQNAYDFQEKPQRNKPDINTKQRLEGADSINFRRQKLKNNLEMLDKEAAQLGLKYQKADSKGQTATGDDQLGFRNRQNSKSQPDKTMAEDLQYIGRQNAIKEQEKGRGEDFYLKPRQNVNNEQQKRKDEQLYFGGGPNFNNQQAKRKEEDFYLRTKPSVSKQQQNIKEEDFYPRAQPGLGKQQGKKKEEELYLGAQPDQQEKRKEEDFYARTKPSVNKQKEKLKEQDFYPKAQSSFNSQQGKAKEDDLYLGTQPNQQGKRKEGDFYLRTQPNINNQQGKRNEEDLYLRAKPNVNTEQENRKEGKGKEKNQQEKMGVDESEVRIKPDIKNQQELAVANERIFKTKPKASDQQEKKVENPNWKLDKVAAEEFDSAIKAKPNIQQEKKTESPNLKLDKMAAEEFGSARKPKANDQQQKNIENYNLKLNKMAAEEFGSARKPNFKDQQEKKTEQANINLDKAAAEEFNLINRPNPSRQQQSWGIDDVNLKTKPNVNVQDKPGAEEFNLKVKPNINNQQESMDASGLDLNAPQFPSKVIEESSVSDTNVRRKREERKESASLPLKRNRRRVIDFTDASFASEPDVGHIVVGFHGLDFKGDQRDVLDNNEEITNEDDIITDDGEYGGVDGDIGHYTGEDLLELDIDPDDDCLVDFGGDYYDGDDDGFAHEKTLEDIAPADGAGLERAHAVKLWDNVGADIELYAAPDRDTPEEITAYKDPVIESEKAHMDLIGTGKDLTNDLEAELITPKKDPVIENLLLPGVRQEEKDTINEARLMDSIPSLDTIEDVSGVLKAAGRDLQQELRMRDIGVDVDRLLDQGDLDPYTELIGDNTPEELNEKYIDFFGRNSLSGAVQKELRDIVNTRQKADKAFKTLRKSESLVDESIIPSNMKTALDEQLDDSIQGIRREQKKQELQGKIFNKEEQEQEADAIRELEQNNDSLIDQRMRQSEQLEEDLKTASSDQVEMAARRTKMLHDLAIQTG